jgi:RNA polymerase-binding transcription factor DksA
MEMPRWQIELACAACNSCEVLNAAEVARRLLSAGRLRSHSEATPDELRELVLALACKLACGACGRIGLAARAVEDETEGWLEPTRCEGCGKLIDADRLEIFPDATLCTSCQRLDEQGAAPATGEFCPTCGWPMVVRPSAGRGVHRFVLVCSKSPPCRSR